MGKQTAEQMLAFPPQRLQSVEARVLGETLVATINGHVQRYPAMTWVDVRAVLRVLERAATVEVAQEARKG